MYYLDASLVDLINLIRWSLRT